MRFGSVLGRIGLGGVFAQLIYLYGQNERVCHGIFVAILLVYWAMLMLIPVPGYGAGNLTMDGRLVGYVGRLFMPDRLYKVVHDPEGLLGVLAGMILRRQGVRDGRKLLQLVLAGIATLC